MKRCVRILLFLLAALPLLSAGKPKLVVAIVIDQFRYDYLLRFRDSYNAGLSRLLDHGAVFTDAHYPQATTVTAVGHSTFMSGALPAVSGIIGNEWYERESNGTVTSVSDPDSKMVGGIPGATSSSPRRLLVSTVGDELKIREGRNSKVISVSIKDRSAVLPGGHMADGAYWFDTDSSRWVSSSHYMEALPAWAKAVNDLHPLRRYVGARWFPFDAKDESGTPFCTMVAGTEVRYCNGVEATPWGNEMIEEFAEAAFDGESLGRHSGTDILAISYSSNDYVGHAVGPDDPAVRDISIRTDRILGKLFQKIDQAIGAGNTLVVLTADHGVAPVPEVNQARHMPGGRLSDVVLNQAITEALTKKFGPGAWLLPASATMPYLNLKLIQEHGLDRSDVEKVAAQAAAQVPHIARVYTRTQLLTGNVQQDPISLAVSKSFYGARSGDLFVLQEPYYLFDATGTSHGTPYDYDTHVPVIFLGPGIKPGAYRAPIAVNDIAPTLAQILGVARPSGASGRVLSEILE
jgi:predicted AlkP superfamily pyrophosphatase or phosphodiesterase